MEVLLTTFDIIMYTFSVQYNLFYFPWEDFVFHLRRIGDGKTEYLTVGVCDISLEATTLTNNITCWAISFAPPEIIPDTPSMFHLDIEFVLLRETGQSGDHSYDIYGLDKVFLYAKWFQGGIWLIKGFNTFMNLRYFCFLFFLFSTYASITIVWGYENNWFYPGSNT